MKHFAVPFYFSYLCAQRSKTWWRITHFAPVFFDIEFVDYYFYF